MNDEPDDQHDDGDGSDRPQIENAASPKAQRRRKLTAKLRQREHEQFWRAVLASETGRREIWGLLASAHTFEERFACGPNGFPQVEATYFHAGEQAFGQRFYQTLLILDLEGVRAMHAENDHRFGGMKKTDNG